MKDMIKTKDAKKGGYLVGKPHSEGGIKGINVDTNQPIEVEGGEVVITKPAVESQETYEFEGKEMKPREILSKINADHGGVAFEKGGMVGENEYATGGKVSEPEPAKTLTPAELLEMDIWSKKRKDESNAIKYELLLEGLEMEEAKLIVMRAISKDNPIRLKEIDRKLEAIARKKGEYALKKDTAIDLLDKFENSVQAEKVTEEIREYNISINGQQSELTPSQYTRVRTEMFMDWFGNWIDAYEINDYTGVSKIINPRTAEPIVLYHGTDKDFTAWTFNQFPAAYFADNLSYSEWFASQKSAGEEGQLYEVFLSIKNPIDFRMFGLNEVSMRDIFAHLQNEYGLNSADYLPVLSKLDKTALERALDLKLKIWQFVRKTSGFIKYLKDETFFDGILMFEDNPDDMVGGVPNLTGSYVAFFTSQIKWATANFFNPAIEDNRFRFGGTV